LKCRPPNNRDPKPEEAIACTPYLERQIELISPKVILAVGRIAAQWLLQSDQPIGRLRGTIQSFGSRGIPLVASYHPAYLLRSPLAKAKAWEDLLLVRRLLKQQQ
ncbi:MAG TPA: uracil-DNA glycosylase, partial [Gammaproteobacteria bacterium]|nr:uracil-DNA glycosylase [Gammaproteobacteria bacterium]